MDLNNEKHSSLLNKSCDIGNNNTCVSEMNNKFQEEKVTETDIDNTMSRRQTRSQKKKLKMTSKVVGASDTKIDDKTDKKRVGMSKTKKMKQETAISVNTNSDLQKAVISDTNQFDYDKIKISDNVVDRYIKKSIVLSAEEEKMQESPESRKVRMQMIARQGRLHPSNKQYNMGAVSQPPLISPGVLVGFTPAGQRHSVDLNAHRPTWFNSEYARMQFDEATKVNARRMMHELQTGRFLPDCLDINVERKYFAQRELARSGATTYFRTAATSCETNAAKITDETDRLLKVEESLMKLNECAAVRINDFPDEVTNQLNAALSLPLTPLMFKKNPIFLDTIEQLAHQKMHKSVSKSAQALLWKVQALFKVPKSLSFHEFFISEVEKFKARTKDMAIYDLIVMVEEPTEQNKSQLQPDDPTNTDDTATVDNEQMEIDNIADRTGSNSSSEVERDRPELNIGLIGELEE